MKATVKYAVTALALSGLTLLPLAQAQSAPAGNFLQLATQADHRQRQENRVVQEVKRWQASAQLPSASLMAETRDHFNLSPRHSVLRPAFQRMLSARRPAASKPQDLELYYYKLLNLDPRNATYRNELATLLQRKHGGHGPAEVQQAYRLLNDAFNAWDENQYEKALRLFRQARLARSPELTALLATHLRDNGQVAEARKILSEFTGDRSYLGWLDGLREDIDRAESTLVGKPAPAAQIAALLALGRLAEARKLTDALPEGAERHWLDAKLLEKQGKYHDAAVAYQKYYQLGWAGKLQGLVPVVYKAQLEDINSLDLIALKFRSDPALIRQVNGDWPHDWVETYRMLVIPVATHTLSWPTHGYVSSHFGYRLHPIRGTWRLHEGVDIETKPGIRARAAGAGTIMQAGYDQACGNMLRLQHPEPSLRSVYCHGEKLLVAKGASVKPNQDLMITGNTGASASNHLHFGVQINGVFVDPLDWL
ncbi:MAG: peptidoglycan DD-metalloendopeptidase family protein [Candidatus Sericytochromatia bacterium]